MDMTRFLKHLLNNRELARMGGRYEGRIAGVTAEFMRNKFKGTTGEEPVILFEDGWRLVPNYSMRQALIQTFGEESNEWIGRSIIVYLHKVEKTNVQAGEIAGRWVRRIMFPERELA
jgi:hypothetical protein